MINQKIILLLFLMIFFINSCNSNKIPQVSKKNINTKPNEEYFKNTITYYGELSQEEYKIIREQIEKELPYAIPHENAILINFSQKAPNCISLNNNQKSFFKSLQEGVEISSRLSSLNSTSDFFVFSEDAFYKDQVDMKSNFFNDSGYFYNNVFTDHDICEAFFILKTNGKFMKYYGEDYFSKVRVFLEMN